MPGLSARGHWCKLAHNLNFLFGVGVQLDLERRHSRWYERLLLGLPFQLFFGLFVVVYLPTAYRWGWVFWEDPTQVQINTPLSIALAFVIVVLTLRRVWRFSSGQTAAYILPTVSFAYLFAIAVLFFMRADYARQIVFISFVVTNFWCFGGYFLGRRFRLPKFALVPFGEALQLQPRRNLDIRPLEHPDFQGIRYDAVVADLRADEMPPQWEKFLARCALSHVPVYHVRQVSEAYTGRVKIEHLSENVFGSLLPPLLYVGFKRIVDTLAALVLLPFLLPFFVLLAVVIYLDTPGNPFFVQERVGYRGRKFRMYKFRSMYLDCQGSGYAQGVCDPRITRIGRWMRKYRVDELPQILNVLKGEMSFIGPRPESAELSENYEYQVPFFSYRHVVRPGISGWAQVNQGYAAEIDGMNRKLQYDFYYIKHFSLWLDILIVFKTIRTLVTGFGAR